MKERLEQLVMLGVDIDRRRTEIKNNGWCEQCQNPWKDGLCSCGHHEETQVKELLSIAQKTITIVDNRLHTGGEMMKLEVVQDPDSPGLTSDEVAQRIAYNRQRYPTKENFPHHKLTEKPPHVITDMLELFYWTLNNEPAWKMFPNDFLLLPEETRNLRIEKMMRFVEHSPSMWSYVTKARFFGFGKCGYKVTKEPAKDGVSFTVWLESVTPEWKNRRHAEKQWGLSIRNKFNRLMYWAYRG